MHFRLVVEEQWFAVDADVAVTIDGEPVEHEGSAIRGIVIDRDLSVGEHEIELTLAVGIVKRKRRYVIQLDESDGDEVTVARVRYDRFWGNYKKELFIERAAEGELSENVAEPNLGLDKPVATIALLVVIALFFVGELFLSGGLSPTIDVLVSMGGLTATALSDGEWYRLLSCTFLHANFIHLLLNGVALFFGGMILEGLLGSRWFIAVYFVSAIGGSLVSLWTNDGSLVSVGASGAIMGIFAAALALAFLLPRAERFPLIFQLGRVLIPALLPIAPRGGDRIDFGAHLGGAVVGLVVGAIFYFWLRPSEAAARDEKKRNFAGAASAFFALGLTALALAFTAYDSLPRLDSLRTEREAFESSASALLPDDELPEGTAEQYAAAVRSWVERYPEDPRPRLVMAEQAIADGDFELAREHIDRGRAGFEAHGSVFTEVGRADIQNGFDQLEAAADLLAQLLPNSELPAGDADMIEAAWAQHLEEWRARYPRDPRILSEAAWRAYDGGELDVAQALAEQALRELPTFESVLTMLPYNTHYLLALIHRQQGDERSLNAEVRILCDGPGLPPAAGPWLIDACEQAAANR